MGSYEKMRFEKTDMYLDSIRNQLRKFPPSLQIGLTDVCRCRCVYCGHWEREKKHNIDFDSLCNFLSVGKSNLLETVCLSGGEPFMYPQVNSLADFLIENDIEYGFLTSGVFNTSSINPSTISGASFVRLSFDAIGAKYKGVRGADFDEFVFGATFISMHSKGIFGAGITVSEHNESDLLEIIKFALFFGINEFRFWTARHYDKTANRISDVDSIRGLLAEKCRNNNFDDLISGDLNKMGVADFGYCKACLYQLFVDADGKVYPCCVLAGDTECEAHSGHFADITGGFGDSDLAKLNDASRKFSLDDEISCKEICVPRLSIMNKRACEIWGKRNFI